MKSFNTVFDSIDALELYIDKQKIEDSSSLLIQVFSGWTDKKEIQKILDLINKKLPLACVLGSTTDGEISNGKVSTHRVSISFTHFYKTQLSLKILENQTDSFPAGQRIASSLIGSETEAVILFAAGLTLDGEAILNGFKEFNSSCIVAGGMAADNSLFKTPYVFTKDSIFTQGLVGVALNSDNLIVHTGYSFDWELVGKSMVVTHAEGNRVYSIDGMTAVDTYKKYLGKMTSDALPAAGSEFPLVLVRNGLTVARAAMQKHSDGSLIMAGGVETGDIVKFGFGSPEMILNPKYGLYDELNDKPVESIFIYSCMGRRRFMPDIIEKEISPLESIAPTSGFFTYGEFFHHDSENELLNQTMTILSLSESDNVESRKFNTDYCETRTDRDYNSTTRALSFLVNSTFDEMEKLNKTIEEKALKNREQEKMLMQQSRYAAMGEMINAIAHQWRQPINALSLVIGNIKDAYKFNKLDEAFIERSVTKSNRLIQKMSATIDDFRDFFKPEKEAIDFLLEDVINDALSLLSGVLKSHEVYVTSDFSKNLQMKGYPNEFSQAVLNILNNAKDAMISNNISKKEIFIKGWQDESNVYVSFEDTGGGIPNEIMEDIFNPYFTTKSQADGTGIGLYMTHSIIVDHMHGHIDVENSDKGALFTMSIPLSKREE